MRTLLHRPALGVLAALVGALGVPRRAGGGEPPDPVADAAHAVVVGASDRATLVGLASLDAPDPWRVADTLLVGGNPGVAEAFAKAASRAGVERLAAYVAAQTKSPTPHDIVATRDARRRALAEGRLDDAAAPLPPAVTARDDVPVVDVQFLRGRALLDARRFPEAIEAFREVDRAAERIGWVARRCAALEKAARACDRSSKFEDGLSLDRAWRALEESMGCDAGVARALWHEALLLAKLGRFREADPLLDRARPLAEKAGDREALAWIDAGRSRSETVAGNLERALTLAKAAASMLEGDVAAVPVERFEPDLSLRAQVRAELGVGAATLAWRLNRRDEARRLLDDATKAAERSGFPAGAAPAILASASFRRQEGDLLGARDEYARAIAMLEAAGSRSREAAARRQRALVARDLGDPIGAEADLRRVLEIEKDVKDLREEALCRRVLAMVLADRGEVDAAIAEADAALATAKTVGDPTIVGEAQRQLGLLRMQSMAYGGAIAALEDAVASLRAAGQPAAAADATIDLGRARQRAGDAEGALALYEKARADAQAAKADGPRARAALAAGAAQLSAGSPDRAEPLVVEALDAFARANDAIGVAIAKRTLAAVRLSLRKPDAALARESVEALSANKAAGAQAMLSRVVLASTLSRLGDGTGALAAIREGIEAADASADVAATAQGRWALAALLERAGHPEEAIVEARLALDLIEDLGRDLGEAEDAQARAAFAPVAEIGARAALATGDAASLLRFVESGRARSLLAALGSRSALAGLAVPPELRQGEAQARATESIVRARLTAMRADADLPTLRKARGELDRAQDAVRESVAKIQREARGRAALTHPKPASIRDTRASLAPDEAIVVYTTVVSELVALVLRPTDAEGGVRIVRLGPVKTTDDDAQAFDAAAPASEREPVVDRLRKRLIEALAMPAAVKRLVISPAGPVVALPFRVLAPDREVVMTPSASTHVWLRKEGEPGGRGVLALGDPDYTRPETASAQPTTGPASGALPGPLLASRSLRFVPLPKTRQEVESIGDRVLLGKDATTRGLLAALGDGPASTKRWKAVHFACHGLVDVERPQFCALALSVDRGDASDDGLLAALDVFRMRIPADLVVLSACETAKGRWVDGEGVLGFVRAFLFAGAPRVIASLWKVDDAATQALMIEFYRRWNPKTGVGVPAAQALSEAQDVVRSQPQWKDPVFWAAWQLWGLP